jgi:hypothetical protein
MRLMKHERIVEFVDLEIETFSIVMEFLPLGSLSPQEETAQGMGNTAADDHGYLRRHGVSP